MWVGSNSIREEQASIIVQWVTSREVELDLRHIRPYQTYGQLLDEVEDVLLFRCFAVWAEALEM